MDIALAVEQIYKDAVFSSAKTYQDLQRTWKDARQIPTEKELADAWVLVLEQQFVVSVEQAAHEERLVILHDDLALAALTYEQRVDLLTNILRTEFPETVG
jgi:hypothetical protein